MNGKENSPIVLSGPSGSGKSELIDYIEKNYPTYLEATGMTTRARRPNEVGRMNFVSEEEFKRQIYTDGLIEYCIYNNNYYGVSKDEFKKLEEYNLMFNVGYSSAHVIQGLYPGTFMIYLLPPNKEELLRRLGDRGVERYIIGLNETMANAFKYDYLLISYTDDLGRICDDFMDITNQRSASRQKRLVLAKNRDFVSKFYK